MTTSTQQRDAAATCDEYGLVSCGGCDAEITVTRSEFETGGLKPCSCGAGADLNFHNRHARWDDTAVGAPDEGD